MAFLGIKKYKTAMVEGGKKPGMSQEKMAVLRMFETMTIKSLV
jgi:hypothetical protein